MSKFEDSIKTGTLVVFNNLDDATVFTVLERNGFNLSVVPAGKTNHRPQWADVSMCKKPTQKQLAAA